MELLRVRKLLDLNFAEEESDVKVDTVKREMQEFFRFAPFLAQEEPSAFGQKLHESINHYDTWADRHPENRQELMKLCFQLYAISDVSPLNRHIRYKPMGYAGDFQIIDWIHTNRVSPEGPARLGDEFFQQQAAPRAVRNRQDFFFQTLEDLVATRPAPAVLNLACGPCRDVAVALNRNGLSATGIQFHCVDLDKRALEYAHAVVNDWSQKVPFQWEEKNAFFLRPGRQYDLVWSSGLFDYLNDRLAACLLKKMWKWTKAGGKLVVGNFHANNPDRTWMEWCGEWFLIHRTEADLLRLSEQAGIPGDNVTFVQEPLGAVVFLVAAREE
jgi:extracellular factor (EF) 3-hydroxypalmitic acid methyl ester biosynthesis protein